jgi:nicotinamidase-related amidase
MRAALLVVDIQEKLLPAMWEAERVVQRSVQLVRGAAVLRVPVVVTEQYRRGLGATVSEVASVVPAFAPVEKLTFSGCVPGVLAALQERAVRDVVICGIEAHVCVAQTVLDLLDAGFRVAVVGEACSSRRQDDWQAGMDRMRGAGAIPLSTEMVLFEWLERAGTEEFKEVLGLVK